MKIGIFGGSFNPIHKGHVEIIEKLLNNKILDKIIIVPVGNMYGKKDLIDFEHRKNMIKLAIKENKKIINGKVIVSEYENNEINEKFYTYMIIDKFKSDFPNDEIYFILGADNLQEFNTWKRYEYILEECKLLVFGRNNIDVQREINEKYYDYKDNIVIAPIEILNISSSQIRKKERDRKEWIYESVDEYIERNHLYNN